MSPAATEFRLDLVIAGDIHVESALSSSTKAAVLPQAHSVPAECTHALVYSRALDPDKCRGVQRASFTT